MDDVGRRNFLVLGTGLVTGLAAMAPAGLTTNGGGTPRDRPGTDAGSAVGVGFPPDSGTRREAPLLA